jgi:hypothetical protein
MIYNLTKENVKFIGRTFNYNNILWCGLSGSGISFTFTGTKANITLAGDDSTQGVQTEGKARVGIYVDGVRVVDTMMETPEVTFCVYESETPKTVSVQVIKLSECPMSTIGIKSLDIEAVSGISPATDKAHRIEFIGDSITCGFGVDLEVAESIFTTNTEDLTRAYAYKTAMNLDADYSMVCYSGYGIISGYTDNGEKVTNELVPTYYDKIGFSHAKPLGTLELHNTPWDFNNFRPELVVINLGTNDDSYCQDSEERQNEFTSEYVKFLKRVRIYNPDATILCTVGIMGERIYKAVEKAVVHFKGESGDKNIYSMKFAEQLPEDGLAVCWHPTEATHNKAAAAITEKIKEIMNW